MRLAHMLKRPLALMIIGGAAVLLGVLATAVGIWGLFAFPRMAVDLTFQPELPMVFDAAFRHLEWGFGLQVALGITTVWAGVGVLRLRRRAARVLEGMAWAALVWQVAVTVLFWWLVMTRGPVHATTEQRLAALSIPAFVLVVWGGVLGIVGTSLRKSAQLAVLT